jgi:hypothetical protein
MSVSFYVGGLLLQNGSLISASNLPAATTTVAGIAQLNDATDSTSTTQAATANAVNTTYALALGANSTADTALTNADAAQFTADAAVPKDLYLVTGDILFASASSTPTALDIGTVGQVLTVSAGGLPTWADAGGGGSFLPLAGGTMTGNITFGDLAEGVVFADTSSIIGITDSTGSTSSVQAASAFAVNQVYELADAAIPKSSFTASGQLLYGTGTGTYFTRSIGTTGQVLTVSGGLPVWADVAPGGLSGYTNSATPFNTALGSLAGDSITSGTNNTFLGYNAGTALTSGGGNTYIGTNAGDGATLATNGVAIGYNALGANHTGARTVAIGFNALAVATAGGDNVAVGANAGAAINTGGSNVLVGSNAGDSLTSATNNVAIGTNALVAAVTGANNVAVGTQALSTSTASNLTAVGYLALQNNTTGANNTAIGYQALSLVTTGASNTTLGYNAGRNYTVESGNTIIGSNQTGIAGETGIIRIGANTATASLYLNNTGSLSISGSGFGTAGQLLMSKGDTLAPAWVSSGATLPNYGSFLSTVSQTNTGGASGNAASFNTTTESRNVSVQNGTQLTVASAGTYNVQFSAQMTKTDGGSDDINIWFKVNGVNVANSASNITLVGNNTPQLATVNFVLTMAAGDYVEIWWYSADANVILLAENAAAPYPAIPSIIATVVPVGA